MADAATMYKCEHPGCKTSGTADRMWNLKGRPRVIVCGHHGWVARKRGIKVFRLSDTFAFEQKIAEEKSRRKTESETFFAKYRENVRKGRRGSVGNLGQFIGQVKVREMKRAVS